jgi:hypothetical protein
MSLLYSRPFSHILLFLAVVNAERASYVSGHLLKLGARTRIALLQDAVETYGSDLAVSSLVKRGCKLRVP